MRKHRLYDIALGMVIMALLIGLAIPAFASVATKALQADYMDIKLVVDGVEVVPKDVNGNVVEPFAVSGTVYLPVRAVSSALGKEVTWDGNTKTVYLGEVPEGAIKNWVGVRNVGAEFIFLNEAQNLPHIAAAIEETNAYVSPGRKDLAIRPADAFGTGSIYLQDQDDGKGNNEVWIVGLGGYVGVPYDSDTPGYLKVVKAILEDLISDPQDVAAIYNMVEDVEKNGTPITEIRTFNTVVVDWRDTENGGVGDFKMWNK